MRPHDPLLLLPTSPAANGSSSLWMYPRRKFFDTVADNRRMSIHPLLQRGRQMAVPRRGAATGKNCITLRSMAGGFADATFPEADLNEAAAAADAAR